MKKCNDCTFNAKGKCLIAAGIELRMSDGKRSEYIEYSKTPDVACSEFKPYVTRMRDANK